VRNDKILHTSASLMCFKTSCQFESEGVINSLDFDFSLSFAAIKINRQYYFAAANSSSFGPYCTGASSVHPNV